MFLYFFVWVIRGYIQTGYPLFPSKIGYINFDWKVPSVLAEQTEKKIYAYARLNISATAPVAGTGPTATSH